MVGQILRELWRFACSISRRIKAHPFVYMATTVLLGIVLAWNIVPRFDKRPQSTETFEVLQSQCEEETSHRLLSASAGRDVVWGDTPIIGVKIEVEKDIVDGVDQGARYQKQKRVTLKRLAEAANSERRGSVLFVYFGTPGPAAGTKVSMPFSGGIGERTWSINLSGPILATGEVRGPVGMIYVCYKRPQS